MNVFLESFPFKIPAYDDNPLRTTEINFLLNILLGVFHNPPFSILILHSIIDMALGELHVKLLVDMGVERSLVAVHEEVHGL
jgi:hypothetical protein